MSKGPDRRERILHICDELAASNVRYTLMASGGLY